MFTAPINKFWPKVPPKKYVIAKRQFRECVFLDTLQLKLGGQVGCLPSFHSVGW